MTVFDPITAYPAYEGMPLTSMYTYCSEKDVILNLIADMIIKATTSAELWRVVQYSMVVMNAEKHNLDYHKAAKDYGISQLIIKYQGA